MNNKKRIYFDNNATTPVREEVINVMIEYFSKKFGNASSIHVFGQEARSAIEKAREITGDLINALPEEIYFTSGGSESDNLAIKGILEANKMNGNHIITSALEHPAVLSTCKLMEKYGYNVSYILPDETGKISAEKIKSEINNKTILVTIMHANNEVGTIQPIAEIGKIISEINQNRKNKIYFHTDAVQSVGKLPIDVKEMNLDSLSLSGHKLNAPKGIGAIYIKSGTKISPLITGGHHERNMRAGTENVPGIVGLGEAIRLSKLEMVTETIKLKKFTEKLYKEILNNIPEVTLNGDINNRLPGTLNLSFKYIEGESVVINLDMKGIAISSGSACSSGSTDPSHVLLSMKIDPVLCRASVRFSLGKFNTEEEVDYLIQILPDIIQRLRDISPIYKRK